MQATLRNPISISFIFLASLLLTIVAALGGNLREAAVLVFIPYFSDIHLGVAKEARVFIQAIPAITQISVLLLILAFDRLHSRFARISVAVSGVILVVGYFLFLTSVQLLGAIH